ncbi:MAG TPA: formate dehydrogenase accessory sulfurtransferase FdhD [Gammaproteobacteria bacterium]|nr:formate dehydrogenase accessory sulfurtransferase FdhD [Gammaproteobacteria bacterium]
MTAGTTGTETRLSTRRLDVRRFRGGELAPADDPDLVATEEPFEIRLGYSRPDGSRAEEPVSVTMRTPGHDEDLAVGFLFTEGIIRSGRDVQEVVARGRRAADGLVNVVRVELAPGVPVDFKRLERNFYMTSSCGVCGKASIESVAVQGQFDLHAVNFHMSGDALGRLPAALKVQQAVFEQTGGLHASGLFDSEGSIVALREDVGRHNALDKLVGHALLGGRVPLHGNGVIVSGRASFELMQKAKMAGVPLVAAVGAPSSLAVELAREFGITLVGFLKMDRFNVYSRPDRVR